MTSEATASKTTSRRALGKFQTEIRQGNVLTGHRITDDTKTSLVKSRHPTAGYPVEIIDMRRFWKICREARFLYDKLISW